MWSLLLRTWITERIRDLLGASTENIPLKKLLRSISVRLTLRTILSSSASLSPTS
jgi:hypothetical protein